MEEMNQVSSKQAKRNRILADDEHICSRCKEIKNKTNFRKDKSKRSGVYPVCRSCWCKKEPLYEYKTIIEGEEWRNIPNTNCECSNFGRVNSKRWNRLMPQHISSQGYLKVTVDRKDVFIHRMVAICFINNPFNKPYINHINGIKTDNRIENLEWCTQHENVIHARDILNVQFGCKGFVSNKRRKVVQCDLEGNDIKVFNSIAEAEKILSISNISASLSGKYSHSGKFKWRYHEYNKYKTKG